MVIFRFFFNMSRKNSKSSKVSQQSILLFFFFFKYFIIFLNIYPDRTITFNGVILINTQTESQKYIIFFEIKYINSFRIIFFLSSLWKITVGGFVNQLI